MQDLTPQPGTELGPSAVEVWCLKHWTRESPRFSFFEGKGIPEVEKIMRNNVFSKENYQQGCVDGSFSFLACEVILWTKRRNQNLACQETQRHQASSELSLI